MTQHAEHEPVIILAGAGLQVRHDKAVLIVASGGGVTVGCGQFSARVKGPSRFLPGSGEPTVSWASYGPQDAASARDFAQVVRRASAIAWAAGKASSPFDTVPDEARQATEGDDLLARYRAANRYGYGDVDVAGAWAWVLGAYYGKAAAS